MLEKVIFHIRTIISFTIFVSLFSCQSNPDMVKFGFNNTENLLGKVKSIVINVYNNGDSLVNKWSYSFDKNRKNIEFLVFENDESISDSSILKYDEKNHLIEKITYKVNGVIDSKNIYKYDNNGNEIEETMYLYDGDSLFKNLIKYQTVSKYNDNNKIIEINEKSFNNYDTSLMIDLKDRYEYTKYTYEYIDEKKHENEFSLDDGKFKIMYSSVYDKNGNKIELFGYIDYTDSVKSIPKYLESTYRYNENNDVIEVVDFDKSGNIKGKTTIKYDDFHNEVESLTTKNKLNLTEKITYKYTYDSHNNWIKSTQLKNGRVETISKRVILYY